MPSPERGGWIEKGVELNKKVDAVTVVVGVLIGSAAVVAYGVLGYFAGNWVGEKLKNRGNK